MWRDFVITFGFHNKSNLFNRRFDIDCSAPTAGHIADKLGSHEVQKQGFPSFVLGLFSEAFSAADIKKRGTEIVNRNGVTESAVVYFKSLSRSEETHGKPQSGETVTQQRIKPGT
jgi:hypothetical protein